MTVPKHQSPIATKPDAAGAKPEAKPKGLVKASTKQAQDQLTLTEDELDKRITAISGEAADTIAYLRTFEVATQAQYEAAGEQAAKFKALFDTFEGERKELTAPLNAVVKRINDKVKPATTFLDTAIRLLKASMGAFVQREEERQRKELEAAQEMAKAGDVAGAQLALTRALTEAPKAAGVSVVEEWDFEIVDASKIPAQFMEPNLVAIRAYVKAMKQEGEVIAGVRAFSRKGIRQRGGAQ